MSADDIALVFFGMALGVLIAVVLMLRQFNDALDARYALGVAHGEQRALLGQWAEASRRAVAGDVRRVLALVKPEAKS